MDEAEALSLQRAALMQPHLLLLLSQMFERAMTSSLAGVNLQLRDVFERTGITATGEYNWIKLNRFSRLLSSAIRQVQSSFALEEENFQLSKILNQIVERSLGHLPVNREPIVLDDVVPVLCRFGAQLALLKKCGLSCPVVSFGVNTVPVSLLFPDGDTTVAEDHQVLVLPTSTRSSGYSLWKRFTRAAERPVQTVQFPIAGAPLENVAKLITGPLSLFLGFRSSGSRDTLTSPHTPNVEVRTNENGWQVIYSFAFAHERYGFGGPTTPVTGYLKPATYRFGIASRDKIIWDPTVWKPSLNNIIYLPLP